MKGQKGGEISGIFFMLEFLACISDYKGIILELQDTAMASFDRICQDYETLPLEALRAEYGRKKFRTEGTRITNSTTTNTRITTTGTSTDTRIIHHVLHDDDDTENRAEIVPLDTVFDVVTLRQLLPKT